MHRDGTKLGTLKFGAKPVLTPGTSDVSDIAFLKSDWEYIQKQPSLKVWYVKEGSDGKRELVSLEAKPGDAAYGDVVRIWLFSVRQYDAQRKCRFDIVT